MNTAGGLQLVSSKGDSGPKPRGTFHIFLCKLHGDSRHSMAPSYSENLLNSKYYGVYYIRATQ